MTRLVTRPRAVALLTAVVAAAIVAGAVASVMPSDAAATFVVNSTGDGNDANSGDGVCLTAGGVCTLRAAIKQAKDLAGADTIQFNIPPSDPGYNGTFWRITTGGFDTLDETVVIDGRTQPGWVAGGPPRIMVDKGGAGGDIFVVKDHATSIHGLAFGDAGGKALKLENVDGFTLTDSYIGIEPDGTTLAPIGDRGVEMASGSTNAVFGLPGAGNVVTASNKEEFHLRGSGHTLQGNVVGMNPAGTVASGGPGAGLRIHDAPNLTVGGSGPGEGNLVAGNGTAGAEGEVTIDDGSPVFHGNIIGLRADGVTPVSTAPNGIYYKAGLTGSTVTVGGTGPGEGNRIGGALGAGVFVENDNLHVTILGNAILDNGGLGIDLKGGSENAFKVTANDPGDGDNGANKRMNWPIVTGVDGPRGYVDADLQAGSYRVELFRNPSGIDPSGHGEGEQFVGGGEILHTGSGLESFTISGLSGVVDGDEITATVTECTAPGCASFGPTSEFSAAATAVVLPRLSGTVWEDVDGDGDVGDDGVGLGDVAVRVYADDGDGVPDAGDTFEDSGVTAADGSWEVYSGTSGVLWVAFGPAAAEPNAGATGPVVAEQTWGAAGAATHDGVAWSFSGTSGPVEGGARIGVSDGFPALGAAEHVLRTTAAGSDITGLDVGFSYVAVTDAGDHTGQGTLRTALANATATTGVESLRFALSTTDAAYDGSAWNIALTSTIVADSAVTVDATTQLGWVEDPVVGLVGDAVAGDALRVTGSDVVLRGLAVTGAGGDGLEVTGDDALLDGLWLGRSTAGTDSGNAGAGVRVSGTASGVRVVDAVVRANGGDGVAVTDTAVATITASSIHGNAGLGIDLADDGVTPGSGPVLTAARTDDVGAVVLEVSTSAPAGPYRLEVFRNPSGLDPAAGEGEEHLGGWSVTSPGSISIAVGPAQLGDELTATLTSTAGGVDGATTEFSAGVLVVDGGDDARAPTIDDSSPQREYGRATGGISAGDRTSARIGDGLDLDGLDDRIAVWGPGQAGNALTVSAWVQPAGDGAIVSRSDASTTTWELARSGGALQASVSLGGGPVSLTGPAMPLGTWAHVALVLDGATARLYADGVLVDTAPTAGTLGRDPAVRTWVGGAGARGTDRPLPGIIDEVRIRPRVLTTDLLRTEATVEAAPGTLAAVGSEQLRGTAGWTVDSGTGRTGSSSLAAPQGRDGAWLTLDGVDEPGLEVSSWWSIAGSPTGIGTGVRATPGGGIVQDEVELRAGGWGLGRWDGTETEVVAPPPGQTPGDTTWEQVIVRTDQDGDLSAIADGVGVGPFPGPGVRPTGTVGFRTGFLATAHRWWVDDVRVRRYVAPEPTTRLGPEQPVP